MTDADFPAAPRPLEGVRVLDFTRILSGPYCTLMLADMGADVIKVERSDRGDDTRSWGPPFLDEPTVSTYFASLNRGKRSVAINFRAPGSGALLGRLASASDVVIENFRPGVAEQVGLDYSTLSSRNRRIVVCSISGYGRSGPYADFPGTEIVVEGMSGLMDITGPSDGDPVRFGIAMVDIATGLTAATRIVASLLHARQAGIGTFIECSLYGTALAALGTLITSYSQTKEEPRRWGSHHPSVVPYGAFPTADGHLITGVINDATWRVFCEALELSELSERPDYSSNAGRVEGREELEAAIGVKTATRPTGYWLERLRDRNLLAAPVRTVGEAITDPATLDMGLFVPIAAHPGVVSPRLDGVAGSKSEQPVPLLGEHTREVLSELLEMSDAEFNALVSEGIIFSARSRGGSE